MNQYLFENNQLKLKVYKRPFLLRLVLFSITFLCFALPLFGIIFNVITGKGIKLGGILAFGLFCLIGFYLLRISLWNSCGEEIIQFNDNEIIYVADYGWFKDGKKALDKTDLTYSIKPVGYEEDNCGTLVLSNGKSQIESVVKMPKQNLEKLICMIQQKSQQQLQKT
jgi:cellulose synthase/poly-beta-1,6-N-acetylglucosamine synthase-like glycosyltransferase